MHNNPTPWEIGNRVRKGGTYIRNAKGGAVAYIPHREDALLIVEAVNAHVRMERHVIEQEGDMSTEAWTKLSRRTRRRRWQLGLEGSKDGSRR